MGVIVKASGNVGPFGSIVPFIGDRPAEVADIPDRLRCDGVDYPLTVLGNYTISDDDTLAPSQSAAEPLSQAIARIKAEFETEMDVIKRQYPDSEREGWPRQEAEARAFLADPEAPTPAIDNMIAITGEDKTAIAEAILTKVALFGAFYGTALGHKRKKIADLQG